MGLGVLRDVVLSALSFFLFCAAVAVVQRKRILLFSLLELRARLIDREYFFVVYLLCVKSVVKTTSPNLRRASSCELPHRLKTKKGMYNVWCLMGMNLQFGFEKQMKAVLRALFLFKKKKIVTQLPVNERSAPIAVGA